MTPSAYFSASYSEARDKFLRACAEAGMEAESFHNPAAVGPNGEELFVDVARLSPAGAEKIFVATSGTHGVEGFCGSGCQVGLLREGLYEELPPQTAMVLVHALNPYGFAHLRRVNEDNVDINRNFIDHRQTHPENAAYDEIHDLLVPGDWGGPAQAAADKRLGQLMAERGPRAIQAAITLGQYTHADGLFYGGLQPVWSNLTWRKIIREFIAGHRSVAFIDLHSGLGPYGYGEPIFRGRFENDGYSRAKRWYGDDVTSSEDATSTSAIIRGSTPNALMQELDDVELTALTLEFGTVPGLEVMNALRADNCLHARGDVDSPLRDQIKRKIRDAFYCDNDEWKQMIWTRAVEIFRRAFAGLSQS